MTITFATRPGQPLGGRRLFRRDVHGEYSAYSAAKCRCVKCTAGASRYAKRREILKAAGAWQPWAAAEPVRVHLAALLSAGMTKRLIAEQASIAASTVGYLLDGEQERVRARLAQRVLAVRATPEVLAAAGIVPSVGTQRRLQALMVAGWSAQRLADRLGMNRESIRKILTRDVVRASTAQAVRELFAALWNQQPPTGGRYDRASASRTRAYAAQQGWVSALAWDDLDDPKAKPKGVRAVGA